MGALMLNHASTLDMFIVQALLPDGGVPVAKREFIRVPIVGWVVYLLDFILIDRTNRARTAFKLGPMHLAVASHAPIVPMVIAGSPQRMAHGRWSATPGPIIVEFLPPIATDDYTLENLHDRTAALREVFVAALARLRPEP